jgi:hypothetical protein
MPDKLTPEYWRNRAEEVLAALGLASHATPVNAANTQLSRDEK